MGQARQSPISRRLRALSRAHGQRASDAVARASCARQTAGSDVGASSYSVRQDAVGVARYASPSSRATSARRRSSSSGSMRSLSLGHRVM